MFERLKGFLPANLALNSLPLNSLGKFGKAAAVLLGMYMLIVFAFGFYWSGEPDPFSVTDNMLEKVSTASPPVIGAATTTALIRVAETMLDKPGGYLSNDLTPPGLYLDNIPNWEFGVLVQVRDLARAFRENFSRSQSQSTEDVNLIIAEPKFNLPNDSWIFPASEDEYRDAVVAMESYLRRISNPSDQDAQFYARADNLARWLLSVESRLGSLSQRLSASVGQSQASNLDVTALPQSTPASGQRIVKTPYLQIDDVFYEARGTTWALMHFLQAVEIDFETVLRDKNALVSVRQIIRELEASQRTVFSPVILNGGGFGLFANHSLVMANYVSRANAAIIDLRELLNQG
ncbi:MAG: DUF2333 family protein [Gammaproteobacteria bacterium]|nr:DUF2333 family protein [Gammaproteobacteria bacterium]MDP2140274.1 DUF2333 family protein [Gammaproteobacteria bacterium]MDP2348149.1 DUF2333 family protein [Gammaproteobacteria bacterium]